MIISFELGDSGNAQMREIMEKLRSGKQFLQGASKPRYTWTMAIFQQYGTEVVRAMGSIKAYGGTPKISILGETGGEYWKNLSPRTLGIKAKRAGVLTAEGAKDPYGTYRGDFSIWLYTGATKKEAVRISSDFTFIGIGRNKGQLLERARLVEEGGKGFPPRPLFKVANFLFLTAIHKAFQNPNSELVRALREEVINAAFVGRAGWGNKYDETFTSDPRNGTEVGDIPWTTRSD